MLQIEEIIQFRNSPKMVDHITTFGEKGFGNGRFKVHMVLHLMAVLIVCMYLMMDTV
jgi:hypothetical protein